MQIRNNPGKGKMAIAVTTLIIVVICSLSAYLVISNLSHNNSNVLNSNKQGPQEKNSNTSDVQGQDENRASGDTIDKVENKTPIQYEGEKPSDTSKVSDERFRIPESQP